MASPEFPSVNGAANPSPCKARYIDIGINLADPIFRGVYNGKQRHDDDLSGVVDRARQIGCTKLIVTGSSFRSSRDALALSKEYPKTVYTTAGIHPCSSSIFDAAHNDSDSESPEHTPACDPDPNAPIPDSQTIDAAKTNNIITDLRTLIDDGRKSGGLVAFGEFGLDYDRLHYCSKSLQLHSFSNQLSLAASLSPQLPLFLHSRAAHVDFVSCLKAAFGDRLERLEKGGVVHSFTGTAEEMAELMDLGLFIGLNGCSFKTAENCEVAKSVRLDRLMLETDGPWCEVRPSHEGWKYLVEMEKRDREREAAQASSSPQPEARSEAQPEPEPEPEPAKMQSLSTESGNGEARQQRPKKQKQQQQSLKKPQKKEPEVLERFKSVKKEKWVEGAMVKSRNEPCMIERVAKIVAGIKGIEVEEVCEAAWQNTVKVFGLDES
ncbi:hypothetical protein N0V82_008996 [Gnomoniopsis sp. IMI 355080]|nr:hypothetical protein N0V82_008996 [Gnomoniopsis sp. IMI 355080]